MTPATGRESTGCGAESPLKGAGSDEAGALSALKSDAFHDLLDQELARRDLIHFTQRTVPGWQPATHLRYIASLLERVANGELKRMIISTMPGSGKSTLLQAFVSWYLGRFGRSVIYVSASAELAERNSRASRAIVESSEWPFSSRLSSETRSMTRWDILGSDNRRLAGVFAGSIGSLLSGWRAPAICLDDIADSQGTAGERDTLYDWLRGELFPRLEPFGAIVLTQTRWGVDDVVGRILAAPDADQWEYVALPAIAAENDPIGRAAGESLWPQRWPLEALEAQRISMLAEHGSRQWATQYLCQPVPLEGAMVRRDWIRRYRELPEQFDYKVAALDSASKTGVANDYSVLAILGVLGSDIYLVDVVRRKLEMPALVRVAKSVCERHAVSRLYVEDASSGIGLSQLLIHEGHLPVLPVKPIGSKVARVEACCGAFESGHFHLPEHADWLLDVERELFGFPDCKHDDIVDSIVLGVGQIMKRQRWLEKSSWHYAVASNTPAPRTGFAP